MINHYEPHEEISAEDLETMFLNASDNESEDSDIDDPDFAGLNPDNLDIQAIMMILMFLQMVQLQLIVQYETCSCLIMNNMKSAAI